MHVTVYHDVARDGAGSHLGLDSYQSDHPLALGFTQDADLLDGSPPELAPIAEPALEAFNAGPGMLADAQRELATATNARLAAVSAGSHCPAAAFPTGSAQDWSSTSRR